MNKILTAFLLILCMLVLAACASNVEPADDLASSADEIARINLQLGVGYIRSRRFDVARDKLDKALSYDPQLAEAYNALGVMYEETKQNVLAEENYSKAVEIDGNYTLARLNYGRMLCANRKYSEGEQQFLTAINAPSNNVPEVGYTGAGVCARLRGDNRQAKQYFLNALQANPNAAGTLLELADLSIEQGSFEEARTYLQRYHQQVGFKPTSLQLAIRVEEALGDLQKRDQYARLLKAQLADAQSQSGVQQE